MSRFVFGAITALTLSVQSAFADKISLPELSQYLNALRIAKGAFTQVNDDGTLSTGTVYIKRPGRMRFEYNPPVTTRIVVSSGAIVIEDPRSNDRPETFPLRRTPLSIILARDVDFSRARMVTGHSYDGTATIVTAQDPERPEYGYIQLYFTDNPVELRQWVTHDGDGVETTVILGEMSRPANLSNSLFRPQKRPEPSR
jgi:outer membrane lipoprotein-sorting protein